MLLYRGLHFILRRFVSLDNKILNKIEDAEKQFEQQRINGVTDSLPQKDEFFSEISIITHAGGGLQGMSYLNCKEAFPYYYQAGNRVFEYDIDLSSDGKYLCTHSEEPVSEKEHLFRKIDNRFIPISITECIELIKTYQDIKVIFDCKFYDLQPFAQFLKDHILSENDLSRIVIQVFNEENIAQVRNVWNFKMLYVCMNNTDFIIAAELCVRYQIPAVSISIGSIENRAGWEVFQKANICTFIYTVNTVEEYMKLRRSGLSGVFSDFLLEKDVKERD